MGVGGAFEGAGDVGGDPAAVEVAGLGDDAFAVDGALVDAVGIEGDVVAKVGVGGEGLDVAPGGVHADGALRVGERDEGIEGEVDGPVGGEALELAEGGGVGGGLEEVHGDVGVGDVVDGWVTGLEDAYGACSLGEQDAAVDDADVVVDELEAGWARVVPYGFSGRRANGCSHGRLGWNGSDCATACATPSNARPFVIEIRGLLRVDEGFANGYSENIRWDGGQGESSPEGGWTGNPAHLQLGEERVDFPPWKGQEQAKTLDFLDITRSFRDA